MKPITDVEAAYIAGMVDGEGSLGIYKKEPPGRNVSYAVAFNITNTNMEVLRWIKDKLGAGKIDPRPGRKKQHKPVHQLIFETEEITPILLRIKNHLIVKIEQAELVLQFIAETRPACNNNGLTIEEVIAKDVLFRAMKRLTVRGVLT